MTDKEPKPKHDNIMIVEGSFDFDLQNSPVDVMTLDGAGWPFLCLGGSVVFIASNHSTITGVRDK